MTALQELQKRLSELPESEREAVAAHFLDELDRKDQVPETQVTFDDIKHLLGSVEGPGDLSTNPKYMDDYGQSRVR